MSNHVPFSWEKKPGVSKLILTNPPPTSINHEEEEEITVMKLPLHPRSHDQDQRVKYYTNIPLPPRAFQPPESASSSRKGLMKKKKKKQLDDPFWAAYKKCTQPTATENGKARSEVFGFSFDFSCKNGSDVVVCQDNLIRISQLPLRIRKERLHKL